MKDLSHLDAIIQRLSREQGRLDNAKTTDEREMRTVWLAGIKKEMASEYKFLGIKPLTMEQILMSDDELLTQLGN